METNLARCAQGCPPLGPGAPQEGRGQASRSFLPLTRNLCGLVSLGPHRAGLQGTSQAKKFPDEKNLPTTSYKSAEAGRHAMGELGKLGQEAEPDQLSSMGGLEAMSPRPTARGLWTASETVSSRHNKST